jgi:phage replication O-like protein O
LAGKVSGVLFWGEKVGSLRHRIVKPNYTQIPNIILDEMMRDMSESEFRVVIAVCRKTFGWQKTKDKISISQIELLTGLCRQAVVNGTKEAIERGVIEREQSGQSFLYEVAVFSDDETSQPSRLELVNVVDQLDPKLVNVVDTQKKVLKEKKDISPDGENIEFPKPDPRQKRDAVLAKKEIQEAIVSFREGEAKKSDPRAADRAYKEVASKIFSNILGREGLVIGTDEQAARRARERGIPEQFIRDREAIYCGDAYDGAFRDTNKKPTAYWIVNELEKDFAVSKLEVEKNVKRNTKSAAREQYERELEAAGISPQSVHV